jgi:pre-mRNA-processing factor 17
MEHFKAQQAELTEDQKELMQRFEEMRKSRLEEHKRKDEGAEEVHKATTVFHGVGGGGEQKGFVEPPGYLRQKEHACFIPKKWIHTWVGHNKGV